MKPVKTRVGLGIGLIAALCVACGMAALAQTTTPPSGPATTPTAPPQGRPSPTPSPTPPPRTIQWSAEAHTSFVTQGTTGPGVLPPEGPAFAAGSPLSPETPYDAFSSAPLVPGNGSESAVYVRPTYNGRTFDVSLTLGAGYVRGSVTNAAYWGESLFPTLNPHLGVQHLSYGIVFPTHPGADDGTAFTASVLNGTIASKDGNAVLKAGWFNLTQSAQFVFIQPPLTSVTPATGIATPESLGDGPPNLDAWQPSSPSLPLHGLDFVGKRGLATLELTDAALPTLPGTPARMHMASLVIDHGEGTRYTAQYVHVGTGGDLVPTTILYGGDHQIVPTAQGELPASMIGAQRQRIFGVSAAFHAGRAFDAIAEIGHSTYDADHVAEPGSGKAGNYYHLGASRQIGNGAASLDFYRNEAFYAGILLPYGVPENVWSVAWSWPGQWLKSNYQLINDYPVNINRQGYRIKYAIKKPGSPFDVRASYANFGQIEPITYSNALRTGFVDGFFLPQPDHAATLGRQHQYGLFVGYHPAIGDLTFDYAEDTMRRPALLARPQDTVSYDSPEAVLTFARHLSRSALVTIGLGRYGMRGSFGQGYTNVDYWERAGFLGLQIAESAHASSLLSFRRTLFAGMPTQPGGPSPNFTGTLFVFEQRYRL